MWKEGFQVLEWMKEGHIFSVPFLYLKSYCTSSLDRWPHVCLCEPARSRWAVLAGLQRQSSPAFCSAHPAAPLAKPLQLVFYFFSLLLSQNALDAEIPD